MKLHFLTAFLFTHFPEQKRYQKKIVFRYQGMKMYNENENFYKALKEEKENQEQKQAAFGSILKEKSTELYSARFMLIRNLVTYYIGRLQTTDDAAELASILANDAATICSQFGWNSDEIALSKYLLQSGRVTNPQGKLM